LEDCIAKFLECCSLAQHSVYRVTLSVCLSVWYTGTKRIQLRSQSLHHWIAPLSWFTAR